MIELEGPAFEILDKTLHINRLAVLKPVCYLGDRSDVATKLYL